MQFDWAEFTYEQDGVKRKLHGFAAILCYSRMRFVNQSLWAGIHFSDIDEFNRQADSWCERINARVHRRTHERPLDRKARDPLSPLSAAFAWEHFATEEQKVSWDGYLPYQPSLSKRLICELADLSFIQRTTSVFFLRLPGNGKTHLAIALSVRALADERSS